MKTFGLIGRPLGHSFSATFFAEKFQREGIEAQYLNFPLQTIDELPAMLAAHPDLCGFNVTIPYKQEVKAYLSDISTEAREIGAVNVVKVVRESCEDVKMCSAEDGAAAQLNNLTTQQLNNSIKLIGYNTDVIGFSRSLRPLLYGAADSRPPMRALVLGTGGASLAVVYALKKLGIEPTYVSRTPYGAASYGVASYGAADSRPPMSNGQVEKSHLDNGGLESAAPYAAAPRRLTYDDLTPDVMRSHLLIVNCSPVGMYPNVDAAPAIPYEQLTPQHLLYDLVYNPTETRFMQLGAAHGATVKNGLEMLHLQALAAWDIWTK